MLKEGEKAPLDIKVLTKGEKEVSLKDFLGKHVVLYFYPKDGTPGCTKEACEFRDFNKDIKELNVEVIGVSKDSLESHEKFKTKHDLNFELWADEKGELIKSFGVGGLFGAKRVTFVINPEGEIVKAWSKVKPLGHAKEVLDYLETIK